MSRPATPRAPWAERAEGYLAGEVELTSDQVRALHQELKTESGRYLSGKLELTFADAGVLYRVLQKAGEMSMVWAVLARIRQGELIDGLPDEPHDPEVRRRVRRKLCQQQALATSKDEELHAARRHDRALEVLEEEFGDLDDRKLDGDGETLGIAGGILKRRYEQLGQFGDLRRAAEYYRRGSYGQEIEGDAYAHVNAAFLEDLLADAGDRRSQRRRRAREIRQKVLDKLQPDPGNWWNVASRAEAYFGLGRYAEATDAVRAAVAVPDPWKLETTTRQLARLAELVYRPGEDDPERPFEHPEIRRFFEALLGGESDAVRSVSVGKVGLGLSGGGFRASFYHLGVLARLAELDVLRHLEALSCVSGGSIVGACYWLELRRRLQDASHGTIDYVDLVRTLIAHFEAAVGKGLRERLQAGKLWTALRLYLEKGALDSRRAGELLEELFYRPLVGDDVDAEGPIYLDSLRVRPADHDPERGGGFNPSKHNWLRAHKVPALVLNATTVNTGHAWQFTVTWMGESPWSIHEATDTVPRLQWQTYRPEDGWRMPLGRAVAASAGVPGIFAPVVIENGYKDLRVELVDGGVYDNQGVAALLAESCNVLLVSDAAGQLQLAQRSQKGMGGLVGFFQRSMETLMERIRQASFADLAARLRTGLLRGMMYVHMKEGLESAPIPVSFIEEAPVPETPRRTPSGIDRELQQAIADLRTDLNVFTPTEARALMACGYRMADQAFVRQLAGIPELAITEPLKAEPAWVFDELLGEITSEDLDAARRDELLAELRKGREVPK